MKKDGRFIIVIMCVSAMLTGAVYLTSLKFIGINLLPDQGPSWYYWKLPEPTLMSRLSAWAGYIMHQIALWFLIYKMTKSGQKNASGLTSYNKWLIGVNLFFIGLHHIQSVIWYDGLAQDVSVWSSQYSVIVMLVLILIMENGRRGLFFGKKVKLPRNGVRNVFKYHGLFIAWALTYTFWYHPMEGTLGHLFGFFYMYMLFGQLSLAGTKYHLDRRFTTLLEVIVLFHGTTVAILQGTGIWSMFFFGFATMFVVTQMYGLNINNKIQGTITALYVILILITYSGILFEDKRFGLIHQVTWIPVILYGLVFVIVYILEIPSLFNRKKA